MAMLKRACALLTVCSLGCSDHAGDGFDSNPSSSSDEVESLGQVRQALSGAYRQYYANGTALTLTDWPHYDQFCLLSGLRGPNEISAYVTRPNNGNWTMHYPSSPTYALCFPRDNFSGPSGSEFWLSSWGSCKAEVTGSVLAETERDTTPCWWGDAVTFIDQVWGGFYGGGEYARISQSAVANSPSLVIANRASTERVGAQALSVFFGLPGGLKLARLMGYNINGNSSRGTAASSGTYLMSVSTYSGYSSYWLAPTTSAACGLTKIGGDYVGAGEITRLSAIDGWWFLNSIAGSGDVWASSRCMAYNQN